MNKKSGKPRRSDRLTPAAIADIGERWLRGETLDAIGRRHGVSNEAVRYHLNRTHKPAWREKIEATVDEELARLDDLLSFAWGKLIESDGVDVQRTIEEFEKSSGGSGGTKVILRTARRMASPTWGSLILATLAQRAKLLGFDKVDRQPLEVQHSGEFRVAGISRDELSEQMVARLKAVVAEKLQGKC